VKLLLNGGGGEI